MHTFNIRNIDDSIYNKMKNESRQRGISINKLINEILHKVFNKNKITEHHDLDDFFGTWSEDDYKNVMQALNDSRKIDDELWI